MPLYPFREADLLQIQTALYQPRDYIPSCRDIFPVNSSFLPGLAEYGYDWYRRTGQALKTSKAAEASDVPFVGHHMGRVTFRPYYLTQGYKVTLDEQKSMETQRQIGKGPYFDIVVKKVENVRRYLDEAENDIVFKGDSALGITGFFNFDDGTHSITPAAVAQGASGATATEKKKWANKTGQEIIADLITAKKTASKNGLYNPDTLLLSVDSAFELQKPYSSQASTPVIQWLTGESGMFSQIKTIKEMSKAFNGIDPTYDSNVGTEAFAVFENNRSVLEMAVIEDLTAMTMQTDLTDTVTQAFYKKLGGLMIYLPEAIYIGRDI